MEPETVTFTTTKTVMIVDADGTPIRVGSVIEHITDGDCGVVVQIMRQGMMATTPVDQIGDLHIQNSPGCTRCTNLYDQWRHVPHDRQSYDHRFLSWMLTPLRKRDEDFDKVSDDERKAIDGIMSILPESIVDWSFGPWPDTLEDALRFLVTHLNEISPPGK